MECAVITRDRFDAVLFDLDGVLTATARLHAACWKRMFDDYLTQHAAESGRPVRPFEIANGYLVYQGGIPEVQAFLRSRNIELPWGDPDDPLRRDRHLATRPPRVAQGAS